MRKKQKTRPLHHRIRRFRANEHRAQPAVRCGPAATVGSAPLRFRCGEARHDQRQVVTRVVVPQRGRLWVHGPEERGGREPLSHSEALEAWCALRPRYKWIIMCIFTTYIYIVL